MNIAQPQWHVEYLHSESKTTQNNSQFSFSNSLNSSNMAGIYDEDEEFGENFDYCNIHGQPLVVLQAESDDLYVNLKDIRKTGFALFRRDNFNSILVDKRQIGKEFELHLLSEAKNYILKNQVACIDEDKILETIKRCKSKLLGDSNNCENQHNFGPHRSVISSPDKDNIIIKSNIQQTSATTKSPQQTSANTRTPQQTNANTRTPQQTSDNTRTPQQSQTYQRRPKQLPDNFMPPNAQQSEASHLGQERNRRNDQTINHEGSNSNTLNGSFSKKSNKENTDKDLNTSSSSDSYKTPKFNHKENIRKTSFDIGSVYKVRVAFIERDNICWVQESKSASILDDIFVQINEKEPSLEKINPVAGQYIIAPYEGVWNRARVLSVDPIKVRFIDFGNQSTVSCVKPLPDVFKTTPALAVRIKICESQELNELSDLTIKVKHKYEGGTHLVELLDENLQKTFKNNKESTEINKIHVGVRPIELKRPEEVKQPAKQESKCYYNDTLKPLSELQSGDKIMLIDIEENKFSVRTKECATKCKELTEYIKHLDKSTMTLENVKVGQLVLCSKDGLVGLYRAVVTKRDSAAVVTVKYVDFPGDDNLSIKSLRNVDTVLAHEPSTLLLTPEYKQLIEMNEKCSEYLQELCQNRQKFTVVLPEDNFDLQFENGLLLSQKLKELKLPESTETKSPEKKEETKPLETKPLTSKQTEHTVKETKLEASTSESKIFYDELEQMNIELGKHTFMCYTLQDLTDITMISSSEEVITYFESITGIVVADDLPYTPEEFEICLVTYKGPDDEEASWYRAVVLEVDGDNYSVNFVDFGNQEKVKCKDIRKFPANLKNIPMLGIICECVGIKNTPEVLKRLKELIPEGEQVDVIVKEFKDLKYQIEIPELYKQLQSEGLC